MSGVQISYAPYNEDKPFGVTDAEVSQENEFFSKKRNEAYEAAQKGAATPEQLALIAETDRVMKEAVANRRIKEGSVG